MITFTTDDALSTTRRFFEAHGLQPVQALEDDLALIDAAALRAGKRLHNAEASRALALALLDDDNPFDQPAARDGMLMGAGLGAGVRPIVDAEVKRRRAEALNNHVAEVVKALCAVATKAAKDVTRARRVLPDVDFSDPRALTTVEPGNLTVLAKAQDALTLIDAVMPVWSMLGQVTRGLTARRDLCALTSATYDEQQAMPERTLIGLANADMPIELATFDEYERRCEAHDARRDAVQASLAERDARETRRRIAGPNAVARPLHIFR